MWATNRVAGLWITTAYDIRLCDAAQANGMKVFSPPRPFFRMRGMRLARLINHRKKSVIIVLDFVSTNNRE